MQTSHRRWCQTQRCITVVVLIDVALKTLFWWEQGTVILQLLPSYIKFYLRHSIPGVTKAISCWRRHIPIKQIGAPQAGGIIRCRNGNIYEGLYTVGRAPFQEHGQDESVIERIVDACKITVTRPHMTVTLQFNDFDLFPMAFTNVIKPNGNNTYPSNRLILLELHAFRRAASSRHTCLPCCSFYW